MLLAVSFVLRAQSDIAFQHINTLNGLTDNNVSYAATDKNGFLWICTAEGLHRYDGRSLQAFYKENYPALGNNSIREVICDNTNRIWIRSFGGYISMLDEERRWHEIKIKQADTVATIYNIINTKSRGVVLFRGSNQFKPEKPGSLNYNNWHFAGDTLFNARLTFSSKIDEDRVIFIGSDVLFIMDYQQGKITFSKKIPGITSACPFNANTLLVSIWGRGVQQLSIADGNLIPMQTGTDQYGLPLPPGVISLRRMADNRYIVGTSYNGVYIFDKNAGLLKRYHHDPLNARSIGSDHIFNMLCDTSGYVFITSITSGLSYFNVFNKQASSITAFNDKKNGMLIDGYVNAITANNDGTYWVGAYNQLVKWNRKTGESLFYDFGKTSWGLALRGNDEITCMVKDSAGRIWAGTGNNGVVVLSPAGAVLKQFYTDSLHMPSNAVTGITFYNGHMWIATSRGICRFNAATMQPAPFAHNHPLRSFHNIETENIWFSSNGDAWIGERRGGWRYSSQTNKLEKIVTQSGSFSINISSFAEDAHGRIYVGGRFGMSVVENGRVIKEYNRLSGLRGDRCESMLKDTHGRIWIENDNCIVRFDPADSSFVVFDERAGLSPYGFRTGAVFRENNGLLFFGSEKGMSWFHPDSLVLPRTALKLSISSIQTSDTLMQMAQESTVHLQSRNNIIFRFSAIDLGRPKSIFIRYRLAGFDEGWTPSLDAYEVRYNLLPPGEYVLEAEASVDGHNWTKAQYPVHVMVHPVFWQTWWFKVLAAFIAASIIYVALLRRERRIKRQAEAKARQEQLRTQGLLHQLETEQVINYFATSLSGLHNIDDVLWDVVKNCISKLGFEDCVIYLFNKEKNVLIQKAAYGPKNIDYREIFNRIEIPLGSGIVGAVGETRQSEMISDTSKDPRYIPDDAVRLSEIAVPITGSNGILGVIDSEHPRAGFYTPWHLQILTAISILVANKIEQLQAEMTSRQKEVELARLQRDVATSQLTATRAQMNPHFIFNALNSVQQYILQGNTDEANKYLSRFSRLQREILNHCDQPFISLQKETDMLKMYLELEQLRFNGTFDFSIAVDDDVDAGEVTLPPMVLQPFVENAIWHGLMPRTGQRKVSVMFRLINDETLHCTILDNGVGRKAAADNKKQNGTVNHASKGLSLVYERLHLLEQQFQKPFKATIHDMVDENGAASGTRVEIVLHTVI